MENEAQSGGEQELPVLSKKEFPKPLIDFSKSDVETARAIVFEIRIQSRGHMNFKKISQWCGWSDARVSQMLRNWNNPIQVSQKKKPAIIKKLKDCLFSVSGKTARANNSQEALNLCKTLPEGSTIIFNENEGLGK